MLRWYYTISVLDRNLTRVEDRMTHLYLKENMNTFDKTIYR